MLTGNQLLALMTSNTAASPVLLPLTPRATPRRRNALVPSSTGFWSVLTGANSAVVLGVLVVAGPGLIEGMCTAPYPAIRMPSVRYRLQGPYNTSQRVGSESLLMVYCVTQRMLIPTSSSS